MAMAVTQVRLPEGLVRHMDNLVEKGIYTSKSDVVRDALRKLFLADLERIIGLIPDTGDSVKEVRAIRKRLAKQKLDLDEINSWLK